MENKNVNDKQVQNNTDAKKDVKKTETSKPKVLTVANVFQKVGKQGAKDRDDLAKKMLEVFKKAGQTHNVKGKEIKISSVKQQISAMIRDIVNKRGEKTKAWWSTLKVVEDKNSIKLVPI